MAALQPKLQEDGHQTSEEHPKKTRIPPGALNRAHRIGHPTVTQGEQSSLPKRKRRPRGAYATERNPPQFQRPIHHDVHEKHGESKKWGQQKERPYLTSP